MSILETKDRIAGALYGFAIGDAMGATTEFMTRKEIERVHGQVTDIIGGGWLHLRPGEVTDDTEMTLCVADALMRAKNTKDFKKKCRRNFISWRNSEPRDIGGTCYRGILCLSDNKEVPYNSRALGNGSLMRALPCALAENLDWNLIQGDFTHKNNTCRSIISDYQNLISWLIVGSVTMLDSYRETVTSLQPPTGYVMNTYNNALYWALKDSFKESIIGAVNDGGDADTIAAITGSISGARFGYSQIPEEWIQKLNPQVKNLLDIFTEYLTTELEKKGR